MFDLATLKADEVPPHLAPLKYIVELGQRKRSNLPLIRGALGPIPGMKLKPEHVTELAEGLEVVSGVAKRRREKYGACVGGWLTKARADLLKQHAAKQARKPVPDADDLKRGVAFNEAVNRGLADGSQLSDPNPSGNPGII